MHRLDQRLLHFETQLHYQLVGHSVAVLRAAVGATFLNDVTASIERSLHVA